MFKYIPKIFFMQINSFEILNLPFFYQKLIYTTSFVQQKNLI